MHVCTNTIVSFLDNQRQPMKSCCAVYSAAFYWMEEKMVRFGRSEAPVLRKPAGEDIIPPPPQKKKSPLFLDWLSINESDLSHEMRRGPAGFRETDNQVHAPAVNLKVWPLTKKWHILGTGGFSKRFFFCILFRTNFFTKMQNYHLR